MAISAPYNKIIKAMLFANLYISSTHTIAQTFNGQVIGITDGDTLTVLNGTIPIKIRIAAIDAPEKGQAFGNQAKQALSSVCYGRPALVNKLDSDRYGRTVADISCANVDAGSWMIKNGYAWVYDRYSNGHTKLYSYQEAARKSKFGLWVDQSPTPPWSWRKSKM